MIFHFTKEENVKVNKRAIGVYPKTRAYQLVVKEVI
jgi:hypothetical protein